MTLMFVRGSSGNKTENSQGVAISQSILSKDLTCVTDRRSTRLARLHENTDGVNDLAPI